MKGPSSAFSREIYEMKYLNPGEDFESGMKRIAKALKDDEAHYKAFNDILMNMRFLPGGRVQSAMGAPKDVTPYNCLSGDVEILTREYGAIPIRDVAGQTVTLLDGNGVWVKCPVYDHGEQITYALKFQGGFNSVELRSTLEHGWVSGDTILRTKAFTYPNGKREIDGLTPSTNIVDYESYRKGIEHGIVYGDGSEQEGHYKIRLCDEKIELLEYLVADSVTQPNSADGDKVCHYRASKKHPNFKQLPNTTNLDYLRGFFRGWIAVDGCVSSQPELSLCCGSEEETWIKTWAPLIGWQVANSTPLATETNYGTRNKDSRNLRFRSAWLSVDDFIRTKHKERWINKTKRETNWRVHGSYHSPRVERVYCPVVPTTHSFALACGVHSMNCFVSGTIEDSFTEGEGSIMARATEAAQTMRLGGGIGYDFSGLRPRNTLIKTLGSKASGPVSFMNIFNSVCDTVASAGHRRGAQMGVLRVDHPDIEEFVDAKTVTGKLSAFNISVGVTAQFMECLENGKPFPLSFEDKIAKEVDAAELWEKIMLNTWDWAEPGVLFIDTINDMNNLWYCETITATNPCGEQPLPPFGACLLGSFNLTKYVTKSKTFNYDQLIRDIPHVVRAMDNVVDRATYPLPQQGREARSKRRMGLGVMGLANAIEAMGHPYGSVAFVEVQTKILDTIKNHVYLESAKLAQEKGSFALYKEEHYLKGKFIKTLDPEVRVAIKEFGIRNSHLTSIAPTGTISLCADNVSSGIEPVFALTLDRTVNTPEGPKVETLKDYGLKMFGVTGKVSSDVTVPEHLRVLLAAQKQVDSAVSKTCNIGDDVTFDEFKNVYRKAYNGGAKGCTTFRAAGKRMGILVAKEEEPSGACTYDPTTGIKSCEG